MEQNNIEKCFGVGKVLDTLRTRTDVDLECSSLRVILTLFFESSLRVILRNVMEQNNIEKCFGIRKVLDTLRTRTEVCFRVSIR